METAEVTRPPRDSIAARASSRVIVSRTPVRTNCIPWKARDDAGASGSSVPTPASANRRTRAWFSSCANHSCTDWETVGPIS